MAGKDAGMTHTPGPWEIQTPFEPDSYSIVQAGLKPYEWQFIAEVPVGIPAEGMFPRQEAKANARLIAAAPELLEALKSILAHQPDHGDTIWQQVEDAVAKAEGRT